MRPGVVRLAHLLEGHRKVEMGVGIERVEPERLAVAALRFRETAEIVVDVAQVEVRLEEIRLEADRPLVKSLRFDELVAAVMDVGEVDERGDQIRVVLERLAVGRCRLVALRRVAVVERRAGAEDIPRLPRCRGPRPPVRDGAAAPGA